MDNIKKVDGQEEVSLEDTSFEITTPKVETFRLVDIRGIIATKKRQIEIMTGELQDLVAKEAQMVILANQK